ncbi:45824_t:CDS:1, partial [Gigaspora margarita]
TRRRIISEKPKRPRAISQSKKKNQIELILQAMHEYLAAGHFGEKTIIEKIKKILLESNGDRCEKLYKKLRDKSMQGKTTCKRSNESNQDNPAI